MSGSSKNRRKAPQQNEGKRKEEKGSEEKFIVLMGPTGSGKSTFIETATGKKGQIVGHSLRSYTSDIQAINASHPTEGYPVVFVDTPGFDDTYKSDTEILCLIAEWFVKTYQDRAKLAGILYLHRISDNRMAGSLLKNLHLFTSLCGQDAMTKVILTTTMWGEVDKESGDMRENELKRDFWRESIDKGCRLSRFDTTRESAWSIVDQLTERERDPVLLSKEIVDNRLRLNETDVGITLNNELKRLVKDRKDASRKLERQAREPDNSAVAEDLIEQKNVNEKKIGEIASQLHELKIPFQRQVILFFRGRH